MTPATGTPADQASFHGEIEWEHFLEKIFIDNGSIFRYYASI